MYVILYFLHNDRKHHGKFGSNREGLLCFTNLTFYNSTFTENDIYQWYLCQKKTAYYKAGNTLSKGIYPRVVKTQHCYAAFNQIRPLFYIKNYSTC